MAVQLLRHRTVVVSLDTGQWSSSLDAGQWSSFFDTGQWSGSLDTGQWFGTCGTTDTVPGVSGAISKVILEGSH